MGKSTLNVLRQCLALLVLCCFASIAFARTSDALPTVSLSELPKEAVITLRLIQQGGPFPYEKDGVVFGNYESRLPKQKRGYYHEYTVKTLRARNRGARRIIAGGDPQKSGEYYYTDDHYESFRRIRE